MKKISTTPTTTIVVVILVVVAAAVEMVVVDRNRRTCSSIGRRRSGSELIYHDFRSIPGIILSITHPITAPRNMGVPTNTTIN